MYLVSPGGLKDSALPVRDRPHDPNLPRKDHVSNCCCPHGHALVRDPDSEDDYPTETCGTQNEDKDLSPTYWSEHDKQLEEWEQEHGLLLRAPYEVSADFRCPDGLVLDYLHVYFNHSNTIGKYEVRKKRNTVRKRRDLHRRRRNEDW